MQIPSPPRKQKLTSFLNVNNIDIAAISETKLLPKHRFSIPGYKIYRIDRNQFGGEIMLITNNNVRHDQFSLPYLVGIEATNGT
jgi:hypothetical protein